jgi:hypothetical protein
VARQRENVFIAGVHRHLPPWVYAEKMNNPYRRGTPDCYYEAAHHGFLWAEYKWLRRIPQPLGPEDLSELSSLQRRWLRRAHRNDIPVALIVGSPQGTAIRYGTSWETPSDTQLFDNKQAALWIAMFLMTTSPYTNTRSTWL